jgi:hypothetical protein
MISPSPKVSSSRRDDRACKAIAEIAADDDAGDANEHRRHDERPPVAQPCILQQKEGCEGAQHILRPMREADDVEHAEDHGQAQAEQRIEGAVDQADKERSNKACEGIPKISIMKRRVAGEIRVQSYCGTIVLHRHSGAAST